MLSLQSNVEGAGRTTQTTTKLIAKLNCFVPKYDLQEVFVAYQNDVSFLLLSVTPGSLYEVGCLFHQ